MTSAWAGRSFCLPYSPMPEHPIPNKPAVASREARSIHAAGEDATRRKDPLAALAAKVLEGCPASERQLVRKLAPHLRRVVREIVGPGGDTEDCLQEALVAVASALSSFRGDCTFLHFVIRITIRYAVN